MWRHLLLSSATLAAFSLSYPLKAQPDVGDQPAALSADDVTFDETLGIVIASGNVEIFQGARILRADRVTYNRRTEVVTATGNVVLVEPSGDVVFANYAELENDLADGFVEDVSLLLQDNSRMIANAGVRRNGNMEVERAVYSPCNLCEENPRAAPIWQIRAVRVIHDAENKNVIYRDAFFDFFGVPVAYTPYFSHPDPSVDRRSGLLFPNFGVTSTLGPFLNNYYYWDIAPEQDATFRLGATRDAGFILGGEYRRRFENGAFVGEGSVNRSERPDVDDGDIEDEEEALRGHLFADLRLDLTEIWRAGADIEVTSDKFYLEDFGISEQDVLQSRAYAEGFYGLSYASAEAIAFQDLRLDDIEQAVIAPWFSYDYVGEPGTVLGGQLLGNASLLSLVREGEAGDIREFPTEGVDTRRFSVDGGWQRTFYSTTGLVTDVFGGVRGDLYWADDVPQDDGSLDSDAVAGRVFPRAVVTGRYPLVRQQGRFQQLIEPVAALTVAPEIDEPEDIPNNDSIDLEFDEISLFEESRFTGLDRVEDGTRVTYGLRAGLFGPNGGFGTAFLGQSYRLTGDADFPDESGLEDDRSDYVGQLTIAPSPLFYLNYRFRLDEDGFEPRRHEVVASGGPDWLRVSGTYTFLDDFATFADTEEREEVTANITSQLTDYWSVSTSTTYDIDEDASRLASFGVRYSDECLTVQVIAERDFAAARSEDPDDSIYIYFAFRNLGELPFSVGGLDLGGGGGDDS